MKLKILGVIVLLLLLLFFLIGFLIAQYIYIEDSPVEQGLLKKCADYYEGFWFIRDNEHFVCIDVKYSSIENSLEICQHEMAHELYNRLHAPDYNYSMNDSEVFAEKCQKNWTYCLDEATRLRIVEGLE